MKQNLLRIINKFVKIQNWEFVKHVVSITSIAQYIVQKYYQYPANLWKRCFTPSAFSVCRHLSNYKFAAHSTYVGCFWANWQSLWFCFLARLGRRQIPLVPSSYQLQIGFKPFMKFHTKFSLLQFYKVISQHFKKVSLKILGVVHKLRLQNEVVQMSARGR